MERIGRVERVNLQKLPPEKGVEWVKPTLPSSQGEENREAKVDHPLDPRLVALALQIVRGFNGKP